jgi:hydrogenase expression/formation protein HypE
MRRRILLAHGGGGEMQDELLEEVFLPRLGNAWLDEGGDAAAVSLPGRELAVSTDTFVIDPLFFPGGDIGRLAVCGTVNDLAVAGADPAYLTVGFVLQEGLFVEDLARIVDSVAGAAREARVAIVAGDTKVVGHGQADGLYLNVTGVGTLRPDRPTGLRTIRPGDRVLVSGTLGDHGMAILALRAGMESRLRSDAAPLRSLVAGLLRSTGGVRFLRDPTRGGLAGVAAELAKRTGCRLILEESALPVRAGVRQAAEILGLDVLTVANEGKVVGVTAPESADRALDALRSHPLGRRAAIVGEFAEERDGLCELHTVCGGRRIVAKPYGEELPRIC